MYYLGILYFSEIKRLLYGAASKDFFIHVYSIFTSHNKKQKFFTFTLFYRHSLRQAEYYFTKTSTEHNTS